MRSTLVTLAILATPGAAFACPVCFGQNDSPLAAAMNSGIVFMLGIVGVVLAGFASFFIYLMRRAKLAEQVGSAEAESYGLSGSDPQKGTAQC